MSFGKLDQPAVDQIDQGEDHQHEQKYEDVPGGGGGDIQGLELTGDIPVTTTKGPWDPPPEDGLRPPVASRE